MVNEMTSGEEQVVEFVPLLEILNEFPFTIRKKSNKRMLNELLMNGYIQANLNRKPYMKHRLIYDT